jgi:hypothetical protein
MPANVDNTGLGEKVEPKRQDKGVAWIFPAPRDVQASDIATHSISGPAQERYRTRRFEQSAANVFGCPVSNVAVSEQV